MASRQFWKDSLRLWAWGFAAYTALAIMTTLQKDVAASNAHLAFSWRETWRVVLADNYTFAIFVAPVFWLVRRYPLERRVWRWNAVMLLAGTYAFVLIKCEFIEPLFDWINGKPLDFGTHTVFAMYDMWQIVLLALVLEFYRRSQDRERQAVALREQLAHAQLDALRSQLHPHFLFNTLNGAAALMHRDPAGADRMLTRLADLLRATLAHGATHEIPLGEELALLERYLDIMRVRFRDRLTVAVDAPAEARDALVPAFLLQPLVENALEHGIGARPGPGTLAITAARRNGNLAITIIDDGPGPNGEAGAGIGIANTRQRLASLYGDAQALTLSAGAGGGAKVEVSLPWHVAAS